jgi:alpha-1,3-rhamnosyl/mannosyltransferase
MRICIDGTALLLRSGGVKNYVYYWLQHLRKLAGEDSIRIFPLIRRLGKLNHEKSMLGGWATFNRLAFLGVTNLRDTHVLNLLGRHIDLFHASNTHVAYPPSNTRLTATLYDMTCWLLPETHEPANVLATRSFTERTAKRAHGLIAISGSTRDDAIKVLHLAPESIEVIYPGVTDEFFVVTPEMVQRVRQHYGLTRPYVLYVGTIEPRKNVDALLDAYARVKASIRSEFDLVIAGPIGWAAQATVTRLATPADGVRYLGYVPETELPALTAGATAFAYPSLYEGFGLPVAQAMATGVPVITSNLSSLPEIAGDAAVLVDPRSVGEIHAALERVLLSSSLRGELASRARQKAQRYRWDICAQESLAFFRRICGA